MGHVFRVPRGRRVILKQRWDGLTSSAWTPNSLGSKLARWGEATGLVTNTDNDYGIVDGSNVCSSYKDLSSNGNDATEATNKPDFATDRLVFTSGNSDKITIASPTFITGTKGEITIAFEDTLGAGNALYIAVGANTGTTDFIAMGVGGDNKISILGTGSTLRTVAISRVAGSSHIISFSSDGSTTRVFYDGIELSWDTGADGGAWWSAKTLNAFAFCAAVDTSPNYYTGKIIADTICNDQLTTSERQELHNYLNTLI